MNKETLEDVNDDLKEIENITAGHAREMAAKALKEQEKEIMFDIKKRIVNAAYHGKMKFETFNDLSESMIQELAKKDFKIKKLECGNTEISWI